MGDSRTLQFTFLIQQVAFGRYNQFIVILQCLKRFRHPAEQTDRHLQQFFSHLHDASDYFGRHPVPANLHGSLHHGERERLSPVFIDIHILHLYGE